MAKLQASKAAIAKMREIHGALDLAVTMAEDGANTDDIAIELNDVLAMLNQWLLSVKVLPSE